MCQVWQDGLCPRHFLVFLYLGRVLSEDPAVGVSNDKVRRCLPRVRQFPNARKRGPCGRCAGFCPAHRAVVGACRLGRRVTCDETLWVCSDRPSR